jgi:hypothetical protein
VTPDTNKTPKAARPNAVFDMPQDKIDELKKKGLVTFTGTGKPPVANDLLVTNPKTKEKTMVCTNHVTLGYFCRYGSTCNFLHIYKLNDIMPEERKNYSSFVEGHPHLAWTNKPKNPAG